jgi:hypothetical protein
VWYKFDNVSEEYADCLFTVEEPPLSLFFNPEDRGSTVDYSKTSVNFHQSVC